MPTLPIMTNTDWLTLVLVIITGFYAWATLNILRANEAMVSTMRDQQEAAMRPYILVSTNLRIGTQLLYLSIKNVGKTAALNLELSLDKSFYQLGEKREERNIANSAAFSRTIDSLPPDGQLLFLLGNGPTLYCSSNTEELSPLVFQVTASYISGSRKITETSTVDLRRTSTQMFHMTRSSRNSGNYAQNSRGFPKHWSQSTNMALNLAPFGRWTLRDKAAQAPLALRYPS